jgi:hypothetical protein
MSRRGNVARLPVPPPLSGKINNLEADTKALNEHLGTMTAILNQALQGLQNRMNTVQQIGAKTPPTVTGLTITGKQGLFHLTWNRIAHVDGYVITQASDTAMTQLIGRYNLPDGERCTFAIPVGNVAVTNSFQVYGYQGPKYSEPSPTVTATTLVYASSEAAPPAPLFSPRHPKLVPVRSGPNL